MHSTSYKGNQQLNETSRAKMPILGLRYGVVATAMSVGASSLPQRATAFHASVSCTTGRAAQSQSRRSLDVSAPLHSTASRSYSTGLINIDETAPRDVGTLKDWSDACGVQHSGGFQLSTDIGPDYWPDFGMDVSAVTTQELPAGSPVLWVPSQMMLSSSRAYAEFTQQYGPDVLEDAEKLLYSLNASDQLRQYYLMLKLLVEYEKGVESPWYPWLNSLPRYYSNAASMTSFCYKCLPPLAAKIAMKERANLNHLSTAKRVPFLSQETKGSAELWRWAYQIVYTRSFEANIGGIDDLVITPMADCFNHAAESDIDVQYDDEGNCLVQTIRDVPAGSQLRMQYADPTNPSFLFARYGFLDESSPATFCKILLPHVSNELKNMGYSHSRMLFYKDGEVSQEVWDVLLYQLLSSNIKTRRELYKAHMEGDYETKQRLHQQFFPQTSAKLLEHIDGFLGQLDALSAKAAGRDIKDHPRLPLIMRHNEFVRQTFLAVRARYYE